MTLHSKEVSSLNSEGSDESIAAFLVKLHVKTARSKPQAISLPMNKERKGGMDWRKKR
jgi:hypothetical protein